MTTIPNRRRWDRRISRNTNDMADSNGRRAIDGRLEDIDNMIRKENDEEKRNVLLVLHCLTSTLSSVSRVLEELEQQHTARFNEHEVKIDEHERLVLKGQATWNSAIVFGGIIQSLLVAMALYGAGLFTDLQKTVGHHDQQIIKIEQKLEGKTDAHL